MFEYYITITSNSHLPGMCPSGKKKPCNSATDSPCLFSTILPRSILSGKKSHSVLAWNETKSLWNCIPCQWMWLHWTNSWGMRMNRTCWGLTIFLPCDAQTAHSPKLPKRWLCQGCAVDSCYKVQTSLDFVITSSVHGVVDSTVLTTAWSFFC